MVLSGFLAIVHRSELYFTMIYQPLVAFTFTLFTSNAGQAGYCF